MWKLGEVHEGRGAAHAALDEHAEDLAMFGTGAVGYATHFCAPVSHDGH